MGVVYLIHLDSKLADHAKHYIGYTSRTAKQRLLTHRAGYGSKMLRACNQKGIAYRIARVWRNETRVFERSLKNRKASKHMCPICNPALKKNKYRFWRF